MRIKSFFYFLIPSVYLLTAACKKESGPKGSLPDIKTKEITAITPTSANSGVVIEGDGGNGIAISGLCWSSTNAQPIITDDTTQQKTGKGDFDVMLKNLQSSTTYYVRAYAINRMGVGYGEVITFTTANKPPEVPSLVIDGNAIAGQQLTASYVYLDAESDPESGSTYQWYAADDRMGNGETAIAGATSLTYTIAPAYDRKYLSLGITPRSSSGTTEGPEVRSAYIGAVGDPVTVTFTYNGAEVTYGIITSGMTGRKWLDRNLGAARKGNSVNDYAAYGDLFQWGRPADGHQLITRIGSGDGEASDVNGTTSKTSPFEKSNVDAPEHNKFIVNSDWPFDWRDPQNNNLWQGGNGANNPCPAGWRLATKAEWDAERLTSLDDAYMKLKVTKTGLREGGTGNIVNISTIGYYWSGTSDVIDRPYAYYSFAISISANAYSIPERGRRGNGGACRCTME